MLLNLDPMELPFYQLSCAFQLLLCQIVACFQVGEYFLAHWHRSLDHFLVDYFVVEVEVEDVEVVTPIYCAHHRYSANEMMRKSMSVPLHNPINRPQRNLL